LSSYQGLLMQERDLHGTVVDKARLALASHEAGHLLMLWLLDRYAIASEIAEGCGWDFKPLPKRYVCAGGAGGAGREGKGVEFRV